MKLHFLDKKTSTDCWTETICENDIRSIRILND